MGGVGSGRPRLKPIATPKHPKVLGGAVKMTPRRYELLSHVLCGTLTWKEQPLWAGRGPPQGYGLLPFCGSIQVSGTLTTMHRLRLVRWLRPATNYTLPHVELTARGLQAIEEYEQATKGVTQR